MNTLLFLVASVAYLTLTQAATRVNYKCREDQLHMVVKLDDDNSDDSFKMLVNIHADSGTYNGWQEVKYLIQAQFKSSDDDDSTATTTGSEESEVTVVMAKSKLRLRVLAADVYRLVNGSLSRNEQCGPITGYNFDCPSQAPTASDFNFQITSNPAGLTLDNYFTLDASTAQTPNQTEVLVSADWTALCNNYSLADNEMFCIEAMIVGSTILRNTSYGGNGTSEDDALCTDNSCVSWASTDEHGQGIVVYTLNGTDVATEEDPSAFRYNANVLFCAGDGQNIVRWDPTLTVNSGSAVTSAAAALPLLLLLLFF